MFWLMTFASLTNCCIVNNLESDTMKTSHWRKQTPKREEYLSMIIVNDLYLYI